MIRKLKLVISIYFFLLTTGIYAQKISEIAFEPGIGKTSSPAYPEWWNDSPAPTFLNLNILKSWYNEDRPVSLRKGLGLTLQRAHIDLGGGGLAQQNYYSGSIYSLFLNLELSAHIKIRPQFAVDLGPAFEYLLIGSNKLNNEYHTMFTTPYSSGNIKISGTNRDYFNQPSYGFKVRLLDAVPTQKTIVGITFSYLWTKSEPSDFYAKNYFRISFLIAFRKDKGTTTKLDETKDSTPN